MLLNTLPDSLKSQKRAVAFIHVADSRAKTKDIESTQTTNAEQKLLLDTCFLVAAVKVSGNPLISLIVFWNKRVEEYELHTADIGNPDTAADTAVREGDIDCVAGVTQREVFRVYRWVIFDLPAIIIDVLAEVAFAVQESNGCEGDAEVTVCFAVVAGENTEATTINGEALGDAEFG